MNIEMHRQDLEIEANALNARNVTDLQGCSCIKDLYCIYSYCTIPQLA